MEKTLPSARKVGHDVAYFSVKNITKRSTEIQTANDTFMVKKKEILLKAHYELGKQMTALKAKLEVFESEYEAIGNRLAELEQNKSLLNRFQQYEDERVMDSGSGRILQLKLTHPAKNRKVTETVSAAEIEFNKVFPENIIATVVSESEIVEIIELQPEIAASESDNMENIQLESELVAVIVDNIDIPAFVPPAMASAPPASMVPMATAMVPTCTTSGRCSQEATGPAPMAGTDPTRVYCLNCPKSFKHAKHLKDHVDNCCGQTTKAFPCGVCNKGFQTKEGINDHMGHYHTGERRQACHFRQLPREILLPKRFKIAH